MTAMRAPIQIEGRWYGHADNAEPPGSTRLWRALIQFANGAASQKAASRVFEFAPPEAPEKFYASVAEAHSMVRQALGDLCAYGTYGRKIAGVMNECLLSVQAEERVLLEGGELTTWRRIEAPRVDGAFAYLLANLSRPDLAEQVRQCKLKECQKFFWSPVKTGPRPAYCCSRHRTTGAKRDSRKRKLS